MSFCDHHTSCDNIRLQYDHDTTILRRDVTLAQRHFVTITQHCDNIRMQCDHDTTILRSYDVTLAQRHFVMSFCDHHTTL